MKTKPIENLNSNTDNNFVNERKLLALDASYKWKKYWKVISIYFYVIVAIGLALFITAAIIFPRQNDFNKVFFWWIGVKVIDLKGFIVFILNFSFLWKSLIFVFLFFFIMIFYRIVFFSLTTLPTFTLIIATNIIDRYYIGSIAAIYASLGVFICLAIITICIHVAYIKNKQAMYKCVLDDYI